MAAVAAASTAHNASMWATSAAAAESQYFYEDVVYRVDKRGNVEFGIVMENDDQELSDDESSGDAEESPKRKKGEIRLVWHPSGVEELVNTKKVRILLLLLLLACTKKKILSTHRSIWLTGL